MHGSVKISPTPLTPHKGPKVKYLNFTITKAVVNIFAEILHGDHNFFVRASPIVTHPSDLTCLFAFSISSPTIM